MLILPLLILLDGCGGTPGPRSVDSNSKRTVPQKLSGCLPPFTPLSRNCHKAPSASMRCNGYLAAQSQKEKTVGNQRTSVLAKRGQIWHWGKRFKGVRIWESAATTVTRSARGYMQPEPGRSYRRAPRLHFPVVLWIFRLPLLKPLNL